MCAEISTRIAERDWEAARAIADDFINTLKGLKVQPGAEATEPSPERAG